MIFPPNTYYLALVRVVKNKKIRETFSCLAIFLSVTEVVRLPRRYASQILNFVSCSDWFSRNCHAPAAREKILLFLSGNKWYTGLHTGYHLTLLATAIVYMSIKRLSLRQFSLLRRWSDCESGTLIVKKSLFFSGLFIAVVRKICFPANGFMLFAFTARLWCNESTSSKILELDMLASFHIMNSAFQI